MGSARGPWLGWIHALAVLLGAFLLFQVQPLLSKWILPWFGGGPAVWTTCLLFFQTALFAGYAYAHLSERLLPAPARLGVHLGLIVAALALLPVAPGERWKPGEAGTPTWPILLLLGANVGLPYFLLSSTGPLVQAWFSRAYPGRSPYRLYALSNVGSLAALLTYPFLVEPRWGLRTQALFWAWSFAGFAALFAVGALAASRRTAAPASPDEADETTPPTRQRALWILLPAFASAMLMATTNQLSQDVAVIPFLWVLPLAVYLASFIIAFDHPRWYPPQLIAPAAAALAFGAATTYFLHPTSALGLTLGIGATLGALFCICLLCHGEVARLKPSPRSLTGYYLALSGGGALGGLFVSLVAPGIFSTFFEWKLGICFTYCGAVVGAGWIHRGFLRAHLNIAALLLVVAGTGIAFMVAFFSSYATRLESARNFYGVVAVDFVSRGGTPEWDAREMANGRVLHGRQYVDDRHRREPTSYYLESSGIGRTMTFFKSRESLKVGVVGLGSGTIAAYAALPSQSFRFYEINPEVERLSRKYFTNLQDCRGKVEVVLGDARMSLEREAPQGFQVLALDAFSGHSVPTHLLTVEAMRIYLGHLAPEGILAAHVSNRFLDLAPVVRGAAHRCGLKTLRIEYVATEQDRGVTNTWVLCTRSEAALQELGPHGAKGDGKPDLVWTDDASDLFSILRPH
jgi:protein-L-isoaspartate O-methyltransferase